jgi:protein-tyrosine phosphatase
VTAGALIPTLTQSILAAGQTLRGDGLALLPTETVYGLAANAGSPAAIAALAALRKTPAPAPGTWHAPSRDLALDVTGPVSPLHRRAFERLTPGPVRLLVELDPARLAEVRARLGVPPGLIDDGEMLALRVPDNALALDVLTRAGTPVVMEPLANFDLGEGARLPAGIHDRARALGIAAVVDDGPTRHAGPSTTVRLLRSGGARVVRAGVWDEAAIRERLERTILFVCTGNTCRSPMAEAIARDLLAKELPAGAVPVRVISAGVNASEGMPMTPEAAEALRAMGVDPGAHRSRELTPELVRRADAVYAMTRSHARAAERAAPGTKVQLLDPAGTDVPDPIGAPPEVYLSTAKALRAMIRARLEQAGTPGDTP